MKLDMFVLHNRSLSLLAKLTCRTLWYVTVSNLTPVPGRNLSHSKHPLQLLKADVTKFVVPEQKLFLSIREILVGFVGYVDSGIQSL